MDRFESDIFICHASEDKDALVRPLAEALRAEGLEVWYDEFMLGVGANLRTAIDRGLARSRFGVVVMSPHSFGKGWVEWELDGLVQRQIHDRASVILPIWHGVSSADVIAYSPPLANLSALRSSLGVPALARALVERVRRPPETADAAEPSRGGAMRYPADEERLDHAIALFESGDIPGAIVVFRDLTESPDPVVAVHAWFGLGNAVEKVGLALAAKEAYQHAAFSDADHDIAAAAAIRLGRLLEATTDLPAAEVAYRRAVEVGPPPFACRGGFRLGTLLLELGRYDEAEAALRKAKDGPDVEPAATAANNLGVLLTEQGRHDEAVAVFGATTQSPSPRQSAAAELNLGRLLVASGDRRGARAAWERASMSGFESIASLARHNLELLAEQEGPR